MDKNPVAVTVNGTVYFAKMENVVVLRYWEKNKVCKAPFDTEGMAEVWAHANDVEVYSITPDKWTFLTPTDMGTLPWFSARHIQLLKDQQTLNADLANIIRVWRKGEDNVVVMYEYRNDSEGLRFLTPLKGTVVNIFKSGKEIDCFSVDKPFDGVNDFANACIDHITYLKQAGHI